MKKGHTAFRAIQLKNNFGITDQAVIKEAEALFTTMAAIQGMPDGDFGTEHLKAIHKHALGDMYPWAGEFRTTKLMIGDLQKESSTPPEQVTQELERVLSSLQAEKPGQMTSVEFADKMAMYYTKLYAISPFPDGNARTTRFLIDKYASAHGMAVKWDAVPCEAFHAAVDQALHGHPDHLQKLFRYATDHLDLYELYSVSSIQSKMQQVVTMAGLRNDLLPSQQILDRDDLGKLAQYTKMVLAQDLERYASGEKNTLRDWDRTSIHHDMSNTVDRASKASMLNEALQRISSSSTLKMRGPG